MAQTTIKQKLFLTVLGLLMAVVLLEGGLRLGGLIFTTKQNWRNRLTGEKKDIVVLCLGESTTALGGEDSYPSQLERLLNQRSPNRQFKIINKGLVSKTSEDIFLQLEDNIRQYQPDIVVSMLGVNDRFFLKEGEGFGFQLERFLEKFRVYKLAKFVKMHLVEKLKRNRRKKDISFQEHNPQNTTERIEPILSQHKDFNDETLEKRIKELSATHLFVEKLKKYLKQKGPQTTEKERHQLYQLEFRQNLQLVLVAEQYRLKKDFESTKKYLQLALASDPHFYTGYIEFGRLYRDQNQPLRAIAAYKKALEINPKGVVATIELGRCYEKIGWKDSIYQLYSEAMQRDLIFPWVYSEVGQWFLDYGYLSEAETIFKRAIERSSEEYNLYFWMAKVQEKLGNSEKKEFYEKKGREKEKAVQEYLPVTVFYYNKISDRVSSSGIQLICMQYPLRRIDALKEVFPQWTQEKIIFVENKENFEKAIRETKFNDFFADIFAGDFGHCTPLGNRLIAENLTAVILKNL